MGRAYLLVICLLVSSFTGCMGGDEITEELFEGDSPGECSDDADNDKDGLFDCNDPDCEGASNCQIADSDNDAGETTDSDGDGVDDDSDAFPNDASETRDSDGDGVGDNSDVFPNDASETRDSDGDGVGDNEESTILTISTVGEPSTLDPAQAYDTASGSAIANVYETLVFYDRERTDRLVPVLAEEVPTVANGGISPDGMTYTFKTRQDVTFHDGSEMDADDVVFSINRLIIMDLEGGPAWMYTELLDQTDEDGDGVADSIIQIDQHTVQFQLNQAAPRFLSMMAFGAASVLSEEWVASQGCGTPVYGQSCNGIYDKTMGTGPYMLTEWNKDESMQYDYYPDYWRGWSASERQDNGLPEGFIKTVHVLKDVNQQNRMDGLKHGTVDFAYIEPDYQDEVLEYEGVEYTGELKSLSMGFIGFNHNISNHEDTAPSSDFFANEDIRKGFCYAFDYDSYIDNILNGWGTQPRGPIPDGLLGYDPNGPQYEYDLSMAEYHFKEAGVWDTGFEVRAYYNSGNDVRLNALLLLKDSLESMNVNFGIEVQGLEWPDYLDRLRTGELPLFFLGWAPDYADPHGYAHPFLHSDGHFANYLGFEYEDIDELIMGAAAEADESVRTDMYYELADMEHDKALYIWGSQGIGSHIQRDWINGWYYNPMHGTLYYTLSKDVPLMEPTEAETESSIWTLEEAETGVIYSLNQYYDDDGVTLVEFFHSRCGHCQNQAPVLKDIHEDYSDQINMFSIGGYNLGSNTDDESDIADFKSEYGLDWPHLHDSSGALMDEYEFSSYPSMVLIKNHEIVYSHSGTLTYEQLSAELDKHL